MKSNENEKSSSIKAKCDGGSKKDDKKKKLKAKTQAAAAVEFDSTVTRTGTQLNCTVFGWTCVLDLFSLVFLSLSCSVVLSCDISTVTVLIIGSKELPCCFVLFFFFAQQKNIYQTIFMRCTLV